MQTLSNPPSYPRQNEDELTDRLAPPSNAALGTTLPPRRQPAQGPVAEPVVVPVRHSRRHPRFRATLITLVVVLLLNGLPLAFRRPLDARSDTYEGVARVDACESLGRAPDVLYLGSSRTVYGIDASLVDGTIHQRTGQGVLSCNAATIGSTFEQDYYTLKRMIDDGYAPKAVVETLWEWNLNMGSSRTAQVATDHWGQIENLARLSDLPQLGTRFDTNRAGNPLEQAISFVAQKTIPLYGERIGIFKTLCGPVTAGPCGENVSQLDGTTEHVYTIAHKQGWVPAPGPAIGQMTAAQVADRKVHDWPYMNGLLQRFQIGGVEPTYLDKLLTLAQQHHIQVALVSPPLSQYFWTYFHGPTSWQTITAYWQGIARAHGVAFYDESRDPGYSDLDFVDPQHLSPRGAKVFSNWLARSVVAPMLAGR